MYQISFAQTSNCATWIFTGQITDASTGELLDLTDLALVFAVEDRCNRQLLIATKGLGADPGNGKMTVIGTGLFRWEFSKEEMATLCPGTYDTGMTMANEDQTVQLSVGQLPIVDGNTP